MTKSVKESNILSKRTASEKIVFGAIFLVFLAYAVSLIFPLVYLFINSFQGMNAYYTNLGIDGNAFSLPKVWHTENYITAFAHMSAIDSNGREIFLYEMFFNSVWYIAGSAFGGIIVSAFSAYALSKYSFKGHNLIYAVAIFTMTMPIVGSTGATFKLLADINVYNSPLFLITSLSGFGFNFLVLYGFFKNLSWSYVEAVYIDGGSDFTAFFKVMLPQARSAMLALFLMAGISAWNDYTTPLLYLPDFPTVASGLYRIQVSFTRTGNIPAYFAGLILSIIPVIVLFSCFSEKIMKNFTIGGLKG